MKDKDLLKQCKREINKANKICRLAPSIFLVSKESEKISIYTNNLNIEMLNNDISLDMLQIEYEKCMKLKGKAEKSFIKMKNIQLDIINSIEELESICKNMEKFIKDINEIEKTENLSTMQVILQQNVSFIKKWIEEEKKLVDNIQTNINLGINLFKNYISKVIQLQKERLK